MPAPAGGRGPGGLLRRWHAWWLARLAPTDTLTLTQRNVYILPTAPGLLFGLTLAVLLVASINYQLSLGYLLTFLLAGCAVAGMHLTHATLRGLTLHLKAPAAVFAGEAAVLEVTLTSTARRTRHGIGLRVQGRPGAPAAWTWTDVPAQARASAHVSVQAPRRGWMRLPPLNAETRFPLGIFRVWCVWQPAARVLVYPRPEPGAPPLPADGVLPGGAAARRGDAGDTEGVRAYRRGDPLRHVVWKKAAKTGELVSRDTAPAGRQQLWLDWQATVGLAAEARLERLAAWVLAAEAAGLRYGLRLPGLELPPGHGEAQLRECLQALALWGNAA
ncbi:DUF58 domain-containing protein [Caldimonas tepidiphila]|uniref:DUF58 domain-containing protein n=1 Tax=Caldimonas tepidiphila TaxID=2315841 RepID=UPI000E5C30D6|nr:DUF58 domain-containing protein [Caldimonas tepidiphila]